MAADGASSSLGAGAGFVPASFAGAELAPEGVGALRVALEDGAALGEAVGVAPLSVADGGESLEDAVVFGEDSTGALGEGL